MTKWIVSLLTAFCLVLINLPDLAAEMNSQDRKVESISVAVGKDNAPFCFTDKQGKPAGWLVDIWRLWSQKTGVQVNFVMMPFEDTLKLVGAGKVDVQGGCFYSTERAKYLEFVAPLARATTSYFFHEDFYGINSPEDLIAFRVGVVKGDYSEGYLLQKFPGISLAAYATNQELFEALKNGLIRVFVTSTPIGVYFLKKYGLLTQFRYYVDRPLYSELYRAAVKKGNTVLPSIIKKGLDQITAAEKEKIEQHWLGTTQAKTEGVLRIACDRNYPPFTWLTSTGRPAGILIDIWHLWAAKTGMQIEFVFGDWSDTLKYLKNGQADIHSGLFESPRAAEWLSFSLPLFPVDVNLFYPVNKGASLSEGMKGKMIGILRGTSYEAWLPKEFPGCRLVMFNNFDEMLPALAQGKLDAVVDVGVAIEFALNNMGLTGSVERIPKALRTPEKHAGVLKSRPDLLKMVNRGLSMVGQKDIAKVEKLWIADPALRSSTKRGHALELDKTQKAFLKAHPKIRIGCMNAWPPMNFLDSSGNPSGIGADYVKLLSRQLGGIFELVPGPFKDNLQKVHDKEIDAIMDVTPKPDRAKFLIFSRPYLTIPHVIVARKDGPYYENEEDLKGKTLALEKGFYNVEYFQKNYSGLVRVEEYPDTAQALGAVSGGRADAYAGNRAVAAWIMENELLSNLQIQGRLKKTVSTLTIGVRKDWPVLASIIDKALDNLSADAISDIHRHWAGFDSPERPSSQITAKEKAFLEAHKKMSLGVDSAWAPFNYFDSQGNYAGICSDYIRILGKQLNIEMEPVKGLTWAQVLEEAKAKRIDIVSAVVRTKEREQYLHFTKPYLEVPLVVITRENAPFIENISDLKGATIAVTKDFATQIFLEKSHPEFELMQVDSAEQALKMVADGKAMAAIEAVASMEFAKQKLVLHNLKVAAPTLYNLNVSIGVRKDWPELVAILNKSLATFDDDEKALIRDKWLKIRVERHVDWNFVIKIGVLVSFVLGIILSVIIIWNRRMAKEVAIRKQAEERFQTMAANVPGAIIQLRVNPNGRRQYLYLNQRAIEFFGVSPEVVIKESRLLPLHPDDKDRLEKDFQLAIGEARELNFVGRIVLPDGEIKWVHFNASPNSLPEGGFTFNGFILDITARKLAEQEYMASERKVQAMSQAVADALVMIDGNGKVLFWNPAAEKLFGYSRDQAMGMDFHDLAAPEQYKEKIKDGLRQFSLTGKGHILGNTTESVALDRQGNQFPVELTISSFQMEGQWFAVGTARDISRRKKANKALQESEQRLEMALEGGNLGIWDTDFLLKRTIVDERWARIMDTDLKDVDYPNQLWIDSIHPDDKKRTRQRGREYRSGLIDKYEVEYRVITKKGHEKWLVSRGVAVARDENGQVTRMVGTVRDITTRKMAEAALSESEERSRLLLHSAGEGIFGVNNQGEVTFINPAALTMLGFEEKDILGQEVHKLTHHHRADGSEYPLEECPIFASYSRGTEHHLSDEVLWRQDGKYIPVEYSSTPIVKDSKVVGAVITFQDITDRKKAEEELREYMEDLERFNRLVVGREERMIQLKEEINGLLAEMGKGRKYKAIE